jgi:CRP/FNR family cyclic AMP-dependent transcriptional regulator
MDMNALGKEFRSGETIVRQGDVGSCMYVIQSGEVEVVQEMDAVEVPLAVLREGDFFGEMALFQREARAATVRAKGPVRVLTVDRKVLFQRIQNDPLLAFRMIEHMSKRLRETGDVLSYRVLADHLIQEESSLDEKSTSSRV